MLKGLIGVILLVCAVMVFVTKTGLFGFAWYFPAIALFCVGSFLLWTVWGEWQEASLWGKKKARTGLRDESPGGNYDIFPDD
jgi:hypothetical protein